MLSETPQRARHQMLATYPWLGGIWEDALAGWTELAESVELMMEFVSDGVTVRAGSRDVPIAHRAWRRGLVCYRNAVATTSYTEIDDTRPTAFLTGMATTLAHDLARLAITVNDQPWDARAGNPLLPLLVGRARGVLAVQPASTPKPVAPFLAAVERACIPTKLHCRVAPRLRLVVDHTIDADPEPR